MYERRGGKGYLVTDIKLQMEYWRMGFINFYEFLSNIILRVPIKTFLNKLRGIHLFEFIKQELKKIELYIF